MLDNVMFYSKCPVKSFRDMKPLQDFVGNINSKTRMLIVAGEEAMANLLYRSLPLDIGYLGLEVDSASMHALLKEWIKDSDGLEAITKRKLSQILSRYGSGSSSLNDRHTKGVIKEMHRFGLLLADEEDVIN